MVSGVADGVALTNGVEDERVEVRA